VKVWKVESSDLPAFVQVVRISKERNDSQAFSVCDGEGYLWNSCFISRDNDVSLNSIVQISSLENVKNEDYDRDDFLKSESVFDDVLAIAEFEVVHPGDSVGHCLWNLSSCKQYYVLASGSLDEKDGQLDILNNRDLWDLTSEKEKCDVRFEFSDQQVFHAHKQVLREKSSVFETHFDDEKVFADQKLVKITDSSFEIFTKFLKWIYGFNIQFESLETIFDLVYLCDKYIIEEFLVILREKVSESLKFGPQKAVAVSNLNSTNDAQIQKIIFEVIDQNIQLLCHSGEFKKWDLETLFLVTARDSLNIDEWQLLQYVFSWGMENGENQEQFVKLFKNIKFEEIHKPMLKNFLESEKMKEVVQKDLIDLPALESMISLQVFKSTNSLEKRILYSRDISNFSSYRSTAHFSSDPKDISILPPVIFPLQLTPDTLTSLPMVLINDSFTLIQPNLNLKSLKSGKFSLECLIRLNGAVSGLPDLSVFRQADYFRHVSDIQAVVELHHITDRGWSKQELDLTQGGVMVFRGVDIQMVKDVLTDNQVFRGCLVVRQFRGQQDRFNSSELKSGDFEEDGSESEPEGEDLGHDDDDQEDEESDQDDEDLNDFIEDEAELSGEEEEALEDNEDSGEDDEAQEGSDDDKSSNLGETKKKKRKTSLRSESEEDLDANENEDEEEYSSEEEAVKKPRHQNKKRKTQEEFSSDEEVTRKKKRKRVVVESDSEEEIVKKGKKNPDSGEEESEYETDSEMGDGDQDQTETNGAGTPEAEFSEDENDQANTQFSGEDDQVDGQFSEDEDEKVDGQFSDQEDEQKDAQFSRDADASADGVSDGNKEDSAANQNSVQKDEQVKEKNEVDNSNGSFEANNDEVSTKTADVGSPGENDDKLKDEDEQ